MPGYGTNKTVFHGLGIFQDADSGLTYVFVVHHREDQDTVEKFQYNLKKNEMKHLETYTSPIFRSLNDVVALGPDTFYATNIVHYRHSEILGFLIQELRLGSVVNYHNGEAKYVCLIL